MHTFAVTVYVIVHVNVYAHCCVDWRLFSCGVVSVRCPSPLIVDFMYVYTTRVQVLYECLLATPWIGRSFPDLITLHECVVKCDYEC